MERAVGAWAHPGRSPDRAVALVWAAWELFLREEESAVEPQVRVL